MISLLYVDDEPDLLDLCRLFLEREKEFSVITVPSAQEALEVLDSNRSGQDHNVVEISRQWSKSV